LARSQWQTHAKVKALRLSDEDFNKVLQHRRCLEDDLREIEEWGRILPTKGTDACVFNAEETEGADYVILVRPKPLSFIGGNLGSRVSTYRPRRPLAEFRRDFLSEKRKASCLGQVAEIKQKISRAQIYIASQMADAFLRSRS